MPDIKTDDGCIIHVEVEGPQNGPVLMLSNSLGTNLHMWDDQMPAWSGHFRLVRYDRRGHGRSSMPKGPYPMERLGRDVLAVIDALDIAKMNWCGLSMGGMVGQWLGANAPARVDKLILSNTSSYFADKTLWEGRLKTVREKVWRRSSMPIWSAGSPRNSANAIRKRSRGCAICSWLPNLKVISLAAKASAIWTIVRCSQKSAHPRL
jgi:pimeloyl-ACP methyl ester carboxylesterase